MTLTLPLSPLDLEMSQREFLINRICAGYIIINSKTRLYHPTPEINYEASYIYQETLDKCRNEGYQTDDDCLACLYQEGLWDYQKQEDFEEKLPNDMETFKKEMFIRWGKQDEVKELKQMLETARKKYNELYQIRHKYDFLTDVGLANYAKLSYIVERCIKCDDYRLDQMVSIYYNNLIPEEFMRVLSRQLPWMDYWKEGFTTNEVFGVPTTQATEEQRKLVMWASFHDNIMKLDNRPDESMLNDSDVIDGWYHNQSEQRTRRRKEHELNRRLGKTSGCQEVFYFLNQEDEKQVKEIYNLNSPLSKAIINSRENLIREKGVVDHTEFKDVKRKFTLVGM